MAADGSQLDNERERSNATSCLCNDHCARGRRRARCMRTKLGQGRRGSEGCRGKSSGCDQGSSRQGGRCGQGSGERRRGEGGRSDEGSRGQGRRGDEGSRGQGRRGDEGSDEQGSRRHEASGRQSQGGREEIAAARVIEGASRATPRRRLADDLAAPSSARRRGEVVSETPARRGARRALDNARSRYFFTASLALSAACFVAATALFVASFVASAALPAASFVASAALPAASFVASAALPAASFVASLAFAAASLAAALAASAALSAASLVAAAALSAAAFASAAALSELCPHAASAAAAASAVIIAKARRCIGSLPFVVELRSVGRHSARIRQFYRMREPAVGAGTARIGVPAGRRNTSPNTPPTTIAAQAAIVHTSG